MQDYQKQLNEKLEKLDACLERNNLCGQIK